MNAGEMRHLEKCIAALGSERRNIAMRMRMVKVMMVIRKHHI